MPLEVRQHHREVVAGVVRADEVLFQVSSAFHRQAHLSVGVHDVHRGDGRETVVGGGLQVRFRVCASAAVGGVALDDRAADFGHDLLYQLRFEVIVPVRFARRELDGDLSRRGTFQRFVDAHHVLRRNLADEVYFGGFGLFAAALSRPACRERQDRQQCDHIHSIDHVDWIYLRNR